VTVKRFFEPLCVFIFGMALTSDVPRALGVWNTETA
jgi:hypothetical protein